MGLPKVVSAFLRCVNQSNLNKVDREVFLCLFWWKKAAFWEFQQKNVSQKNGSKKSTTTSGYRAGTKTLSLSIVTYFSANLSKNAWN